jgi:exonuclease SbcD
MNILHTSDWHLGQTLHLQNRDDEHSLFLEWLLETIIQNDIECLIHSGDVFDVGNPSNSSRELYFSFLSKLQNTKCKTTIIIAGNHDSPMMLQHTSPILAKLQIFVITTAQNSLQVIPISNSNNEVEALCCPIPYLRDQDLLLYKQDESIEDTKERLRLAIESYYIKAYELAQQQNSTNVPIILTGHLVAHKGELSESQSERPIHRQNFGELQTSNLPDGIAYIALGHLHKPQQIHGGVFTQYAGSPIPLSFQEVNYKHSVVILTVQNSTTESKRIPIPRFRTLLRISITSIEEFETNVRTAIANKTNTLSPTWIECEFVDSILTDTIRNDIQTIAQRYDALILKFIQSFSQTTDKTDFTNIQKDINSYSEYDMFSLALESNSVRFSDEEKAELHDIFVNAFEEFHNSQLEGK